MLHKIFISARSVLRYLKQFPSIIFCFIVFVFTRFRKILNYFLAFDRWVCSELRDCCVWEMWGGGIMFVMVKVVDFRYEIAVWILNFLNEDGKLLKFLWSSQTLLATTTIWTRKTVTSSKLHIIYPTLNIKSLNFPQATSNWAPKSSMILKNQ